MKRTFISLFSILFLLPISTLSQASDNSTSRITKQAETWTLKFDYSIPRGTPGFPVTFIKRDDQGNYSATLGGTPTTILLKITGNSFSSEFPIWHDILRIEGIIDQSGMVKGRWAARSTHSGKIVGYIQK